MKAHSRLAAAVHFSTLFIISEGGEGSRALTDMATDTVARRRSAKVQSEPKQKQRWSASDLLRQLNRNVHRTEVSVKSTRATFGLCFTSEIT